MKFTVNLINREYLINSKLKTEVICYLLMYNDIIMINTNNTKAKQKFLTRSFI